MLLTMNTHRYNHEGIQIQIYNRAVDVDRT